MATPTSDKVRTLEQSGGNEADFVLYSFLTDLFGEVQSLSDLINRVQVEKAQQGEQGVRGERGEAGRDGSDGTDGIDGDDGQDGSPDTPDQVVVKINDARIKIKLSQIEGLEKALAARGKNMLVPMGGGSTAKIVTYYDASAQLNGVLTTFQLPSFFKIIDVKLSAVPVLRQITDYTIDPTNMRISFTSQVNTATSLAAGQSLIIIYAE